MQGYASRDSALQILMDHETTGAFLKDLFPTLTKDLTAPDKALVREMTLGVIRNLTLLDSNIDPFAEKKPIGVLRAILRLTAYQILFMDVPDFASVNVGVELAKKYMGTAPAGFVNVVLKKISKHGLKRETGHSFSSMSVNYSHPEWLLRRWFKRLGRKGLMQALERNNQEAPVWIRVNVKRVHMNGNKLAGVFSDGELAIEKVQAELKELNIETERDGFAPVFLRIVTGARGGGGRAVLQSNLFLSGQIAFQDPAAWLIAELADWKSGQSFLDLCSAPGGKAACILEREYYLNPNAEIKAELKSNSKLETKSGANKVRPSEAMICNDISFRRLQLIRDSKERLGHKNLLPLIMDPAQNALRTVFDVVVIDAPCSNLGVLRRRPEARWSHSAADLRKFASKQLALLNEAAKLTAPKGKMIYATCSPEEEETVDVIHAFLKTHEDWTLLDAAENLPVFAVKNGFLWLHPGESDYDGFFGACLVRKS